MKQPNILVIMTDQQATSTLGAYGSRICQTPNLDHLAQESVVFDEAYTVCPICTPARASIQTGIYPFRHGMITNIYTRGCLVHELPDGDELLSRRMQANGYQIGYTGKWHLGAGKDETVLGGTEYPSLARLQKSSGLPCDVGYMGDSFKGHGCIGEDYPEFRKYLREKGIEYRFNVVIPDYPHTAEILSDPDGTVPHFLTDQAMAHIQSLAAANKPFFYMLNHWQPHEPYHVPTKWLDLYRNVSIPPYVSFEEDQKEKPFIHNVQRCQDVPEWRDFETLLRFYYAAVSQIDDEVGRLLTWLQRKGLYDNTVIIFTSDHGETLGVHNRLLDKGLNMYQETVHIPLMIKPAKAMPVSPHREKSLVNTCDIYSTILEMAGTPRTVAQRDGLSLYPLLVGESVPWRDCTVAESSGIDQISYTQRMMRIGNYKFVFHSGPLDELYDLEKDPFEMHNLALDSAYAELCMEARTRLRRWMKENGDGFLVRYDNLCAAKNNVER